MSKSGKAVNDGKLNYTEGNELERDFALSPETLSRYGLLLPTAKINVGVGSSTVTVEEALVAKCQTMVAFDGTTSPLKTARQGGNVLGVDFLKTNGKWCNIKCIVDSDGNDGATKPLSSRSQHSVEIAKGRGYQVARHLIVDGRYTVLLLIPAGNNRYIVAEFDYGEYYRRCKSDELMCGFKYGYDKCLKQLGIEIENYGTFYRVKNEKHKFRGKKNNLLTLEVNPFCKSFQTIYPYPQWITPPTMYYYDTELKIFTHLPEEDVPF